MRVEDIKEIGAVGPGTMGSGTALAYAMGGYPVTMVGRTQQSLERGFSNIERYLGLMTQHQVLTQAEADTARARITGTTDFEEGVHDVDVVIESVAEQLPVKQEIFARLDRACPQHTILTSNTSGLRATDLGAATNRPDRVIVTHCWNPPALMRLVEVVPGEKTSEETLQVTLELMKKIGKMPIAVRKEVPGFIGVRLFHAIFREAFALIQDGVASAEDIDTAVKEGFGLRFPVIGPVENMDVVGLDLIQDIHKYLLKELDRSTEPQRILREKVARGELGVKTGKGFYDWSQRSFQALLQARDEEVLRWVKKWKGG